MPRLLVYCLSLVAALAGGCVDDGPISARFGEITLCNDLEGGLPPECVYSYESSTGGGTGPGYPDLPSPGTSSTSVGDATSFDPTYPSPTWGTTGTTYLDPTYFDATNGPGSTTYIDPTNGPGSTTYIDPTNGPGSTTYIDPTNGPGGTTYIDPTNGPGSTTYIDPTNGPGGTTYDDPTNGTETGGTMTDGTETSSGETDTDDDTGDDVTGAPANACSAQCPFAQGEGLPAMVGPGSKLPFVQGCAENGAPNKPPTSAIVECLSNLACHLGRNPGKLEALEALGVGRLKSMLGSNVTYSASSSSGQPITNASSDKPEGIRSLRAISAPFFEGAPWCSFTTLADDFTLECMNIGFLGAPDLETCGTEPVGIQLNELCEKIDATTVAPASAAVFKDLAEVGVNGGQDSCSVCHDKMEAKAKNGKDCYFFPIAGPTALCPTRALKATCAAATDTPSCADNSQPYCPSVTKKEGAIAKCTNGNDATCPGPANAVCKIDDGVFGKDQSLPTDFADGSLCTTMKQIKKNAAAEIQQGPSLPWTDTSFIDAYIAKFCTAP